jgi:hypothetical protein
MCSYGQSGVTVELDLDSIQLEEGVTSTVHEIYWGVNRPARHLINLWAQAGNPTSYNPLPLSYVNKVEKLNSKRSYTLTLKAKSGTNAQLMVSTYRRNIKRVTLNAEFQNIMVNFIWEELTPDERTLYILDMNSVGNIVIQDIVLTENALNAPRV